MFMVALIFAGTNTIYAQYVTILNQVPTTCPAPTALDAACAGTLDELHPQAGIEYTYEVLTTTDATDDILWFVVNYADYSGTDSLINTLGDMSATLATYIDAGDGNGDYISSIGEANTYNIAPVSGAGGNNDHSIEITWKAFDGKLPAMVLLVAYVVDDAGCTDNIAVYRILPIFNFTLDIAAIDDDGDVMATPEECVSPIESAFYNATTDVSGEGTLTVNYGENWVYFIVTAANFAHSWQPTFELTYSGTVADALDASWNYQSAANTATGWTAIDPTTGASTGPVLVVNALGADDGTGECIVVRVRIDHGTVAENADAATTVHLGVDGIMYDANAATGDEYINADLADLHHEDCLSDDFDNDFVDYSLTPRPEIDEVDPTPFEDKTGDN